MRRYIGGAFLLTLTLMVAACGDDNPVVEKAEAPGVTSTAATDTGGTTGTPASTVPSTGTGATQTPAATRTPTPAVGAGGSSSSAQLSDCEAGKRVRDIGQRLSGLDIRLLSSLTPAASSETKEAAVKSLDTFDAALAQFVSEVRGLNVAPELRALRDTYADAYTAFRQVIPDLKEAAMAGDSTRLLQRFSKGADDASARITQCEQANPELIKRIEATTCP